MTRIPQKKEFVRTRVRDEIVRGRYQPGEPISERAIAEKYSVSRVPVREALFQLERDGLVEILPGRGAQVRKFNSSNIESLYQTREAVEGMAARLAAERMDRRQLDGFREKFEAAMASSDVKDPQAITRLGDDFHRTIIEGSRNSMVISFCESMADLVHLARRLSYGFLVADAIKRVSQEHLEILDAIAEGQSDLAERRMRLHISSWRDVVLKQMDGDVDNRNRRT